MIRLNKIAQKFLSELHSAEVTLAFETLALLNEQMETKNDPDPIEIRLVESIYHFIEKLKTLEHNIQSYVEDTSEVPSNKLEDLYDREPAVGMSDVLFKQ